MNHSLSVITMRANACQASTGYHEPSNRASQLSMGVQRSFLKECPIPRIRHLSRSVVGGGGWGPGMAELVQAKMSMQKGPEVG